MTNDGAAANGIDNLDELDGKSFALVLVKDDDEVACCVGTARRDGKKLFFERPGMLRALEIPEHRLGYVTRTPSQVRDIIEADYFVRLTVGSLPEDAAPGEYLPLRVKWPSD